MSDIKVSVVLPTYNESENISLLINGILQNVHDKIEIIVIDDDSPDKTWEVVEKLKLENVRVIRRTSERGLASALSRGISEAKGDSIVWMDSDLSMPPSAIPEMIANLRNYDIVVGSRYVPGAKDARPFSRVFTSRIFNFYANLILGFKVKDMDSGFMAVRKEVFKTVPLENKGYGEYCISFIYNCIKSGFSIKEIPYAFEDRKRGDSKTNAKWYSLPLHGYKYGVKVLKIRFAPKK